MEYAFYELFFSLGYLSCISNFSIDYRWLG